MLVCHAHRFIFLKTRKTASTSVEIALSPFACGDNDIVTRVSDSDEPLRAALGALGARNEAMPYRAYKFGDWRRLVLRRRSALVRGHAEAAQVRRIVGARTWNSYFKFCVERNPYDKAISLYYWRTRDQSPRPSLSEYLETVERRSLSNFHIYSIGGRVAVDRVIPYEDLSSGLQQVFTHLGLRGELELPRAKGDHRSDRRPYTELLSEGDRSLIERACSREIAEFGYSFGAERDSSSVE
jgi:hypothetical protein